MDQAIRKTRSGSDRFDVARLVALLDPVAALKQQPCDWEFALYAKPRRAQAPDRAGMVTYLPILRHLVSVAPRCLPAHTLLRHTWLELNSQHKIRDVSHGRKQSDHDWADECAGAGRVVMKHIMDLAKSGTKFLVPELRELVAAVQVSDEHPPVVEPPRRALRKNDSIGSDAVVCSIDCQCLACRKAVFVDDDATSAASSDVADTPVIPPPGRGAVAVAVHREKEEGIAKRPAKPFKRPAAACHTEVEATQDFRIVRRTKPHGETYLMMNGRYLCTCSQRMSSDYDDIIVHLRGELEAGSTEPRAAKERVLHLARAWAEV